jgi:hypothetical protein
MVRSVKGKIIRMSINPSGKKSTGYEEYIK